MSNEVTLERMKFGLSTFISKELESFAIEPDVQITRSIGGNMVATLRQDVFGEQVLHETVRYPADWWQAFKERWFPVWLKRQFPVRYEEHEFDARFLYPSIPAKNPKFKSVLRTNYKANEMYGGEHYEPEY